LREARGIALSRTLQIASVAAWPSSFARLSASIVSSVSPDCEIVTTSWRGLGIDSR
jgi:hypothetical protein